MPRTLHIAFLLWFDINTGKEKHCKILVFHFLLVNSLFHFLYLSASANLKW